MKNLIILLLLSAICCLPNSTYAQKKKKKDDDKAAKAEKPKHYLDTLSLSGLKFRSIGPAMTSGRIADIAVHPDNRSIYYVASASGGVWKTTNAGTTFQPIFDSQGSFSIGCVTLDPNNSNVVWVGTGENNNQRAVNYGDGVYKSEDGGKSWKNMGLKNSEHIGKIVVHPDSSNVVYVAAQGPLWSAGGDRGLYKTSDGGETWKAVLEIDEDTGVTDLVLDPRNPNVIYAAAYQRRRHVFTYVGGGPGSALHKSTDGGQTWKKINKGLPNVEKGRMSLAISPVNPEKIYLMVEAAQGKSGFYRSTNRGASWEKRNSYSTSGNYYNEIFAHPTKEDVVFAMDTWMNWTTDGGKTFNRVNEKYKHVDNHCIWIDPNQPDYYLVGCDGGIYETFDAAKTWHFKENLPVTQFYKVAVDNAEPFYNVYGGTQDNFSLGGPSRTRNQHGIMNSDWFITNGGDGFESQIDPNNPNIVYAQSQYGNLVRYDKASGETMGIQPKPREGEDAYRWNWDAPLEVSKHLDTRIYFAANKLFKSDDRGNTWEVISEDLTRQIDRNTLKVMGRVQSMDAVVKNASTSPYGAAVAFSESPLNENLLYVGTDDGLIQITEDGGKSWTKIEQVSGVPERTYINALLASQHDENVVYAVLNNHKNGDFKPYVYKSSDKGRTWASITANLPERGSAYSIAEDHVDKDLLFVGTEFTCHFTNDGGGHWKKLANGLPTICVRDIAIQKRENDLVLATFGRGFYILDDYSPLRHTKQADLADAGKILPVKDALLYIESLPLGLRGNSFQGHSFFSTPNPEVGATFTYYIKDGFISLKKKRQKREKALVKTKKDVRYATYEELEAERKEEGAYLLFTIKDSGGNIVRELKSPMKKGMNRITWDGRYPSPSPISLKKPSFDNPFSSPDVGPMAMPGPYVVSLAQSVNGEWTELGQPVTFELKSLGGTTLPATNRKDLVEFQKAVADLSRTYSGANRTLRDLSNRLKHIRKAIFVTPTPAGDLLTEVKRMEDEMADIRKVLSGDRIASKLDKSAPYSLGNRLGYLTYEMSSSTSAPTTTQREAYRIVSEKFPIQLAKIKQLTEDLKVLEDKLEAAGAPYTPGRAIKLEKE